MVSKLKSKIKKYPKIYSILREIYFAKEQLKFCAIYVASIPFLLIPIKNNKIVICNYFGKGYGDNGKYIVEEIIKQGLDYDTVWMLKRELIGNTEIPDKIRIVKYKSIKALYEMATAKVWIDNSRKEFYPIKRTGQYYIQTWHGGIALKKIEKDVASKLSNIYVKAAKQDSKMADAFISNSQFCTKMYRKAFWFNGEILEMGSPRCDLLISGKEHVKQKVKSYYGIGKNTKLLIYAPTFRKNGKTDAYNIDFNKLIEVLTAKFEGEWKILIRLHPNISSKSNFMSYSSKVINATEYEDMYELLSASDILITDYSSTMFEFSFMKKPVFLYTTDLEDYMEERNFYFQLEKLPYYITEDNDSG